MFTLDHFDGTFEGFETEIIANEDGSFTAKGLGMEATDRFQETALDELNHKIFDAISRGELIPDMGN